MDRHPQGREHPAAQQRLVRRAVGKKKREGQEGAGGQWAQEKNERGEPK